MTHKRPKNYALLALFIVFTMAAVPSVLPSLLAESKTKDHIINSITDDRGLTSVQYVQDGKEWALDYLDTKQLDSLKRLFSGGCVGPCPNGYCGATFQGELGCHCCKPCILHDKPKKPGN